MMTRTLLLGALVVAPVLAAIGMSGSEPTVSAQCRAVFGSMNDGVCLDEPSAPAPADAPSFNWGGPGPDGGISSTPLFPGQTVQIPLA